MEKIIFGIVLLHVIISFGWVLYKIQFQKKKPKNDNQNGK